MSDQPNNSIQKKFEGLDLDGDGAFSDFYADAAKSFKANGTSFTNTDWEPATSFTLLKDSQGYNVGNGHFHGLREGEQLVLGSGVHGAQEKFHNITCSDFKGGEVVINDYAIVNGVKMDESVLAKLHIGGRAQVNELSAEGAQIIELSAQPGAQIVRGHFENATINQASELEGSIWRNCEFLHANLQNVNFKGARLSETSFVSSDMAGVDFTGASLSGVSFVDVDVSKINAKGAYFHNVLINGQSINSGAEFEALQAKAAALQQAGPGIMQGMGSIAAMYREQNAPAQAPPIDLASLQVSGGQQTSITQQQQQGPSASPDASGPSLGGGIGL
jgi:uncharacterized protein YjbI with pentapeptide repeats